MSSPIDTEDWSICAWMDWKQTKDKVRCTSCSGTGKVGGGLADMEGPRDCDTCYGSGMKTFYPATKKPEIPKALLDHMHKAWIYYWEVNSLLKGNNE